MSFSKLLSESGVVERKKKELVVKVGEQELTFTATQISHVRKMEVDALLVNGMEAMPKLISYTITDSAGVNISQSQVLALPEQYAEVFLSAALEVNGYTTQPEPEDTAKKN